MIQPLTKPRRVRDEAYLAWIRTLPCLTPTEWCDGPTEANHILPVGGGKVGSKTDDNRTVPACRYHHDKYHRYGRAQFEADYALDLEREILRLQRAFKPPVKRERVTRTAKLSITGTCARGHSTKVPWKEIVPMLSFARFYCSQCRAYVEVR